MYDAGVGLLNELRRIPEFEVVKFGHVVVPKHHAQLHYAMHQDKPFYEKLVTQISSPIGVLLLVVQGVNVVSVVKQKCGPALCNTDDNHDNTLWRNKYGIHMGLNAIHASGSVAEATAEIQLWTNAFAHSMNNSIDIYCGHYPRDILFHTQLIATAKWVGSMATSDQFDTLCKPAMDTMATLIKLNSHADLETITQFITTNMQMLSK